MVVCGCFAEYIATAIQSQKHAHLITMIVSCPCSRAGHTVVPGMDPQQVLPNQYPKVKSPLG